MNVLLVDTASALWDMGIHVRHSKLDPIGIEYIAATCAARGHKAEILPPGFADQDVEAAILRSAPDVVGLSAMTFSFPDTIRLSQKIRKLAPRTKIILGGYHPSALPGVVRCASIDAVVVGEGEKTFAELLDTLQSHRELSGVEGVAYWEDGLKVNAPRDRIENLDGLPFPLRSQETLKHCRIGGLSYPPPSKQKSVCQITYSRGCPYECRFCNSPQLWSRQVRWRSSGNLADEIDYLHEEFGTNSLFFTDLTFDLNKARVSELCREMTRRRIEVNWYAMCRPIDADQGLLLQMKQAGCTKVSYGVDSVQNSTLSRVKPGQGIDRKEVKATLELASNLGFAVKAYVIIGYPWEDKESLGETSEILKHLDIDELRLSFLTPFPGTPLYDEFKRDGLLQTEDFSRYTSDEPVVTVRGVAREELIEIRNEIFKAFYESSQYQMRRKRKLREYPHLRQSYDEFFAFLREKGMS